MEIQLQSLPIKNYMRITMNNYLKPEPFLEQLQDESDAIIGEVKAFNAIRQEYDRELKSTQYFNTSSSLNRLEGWNLIRFFVQGIPFLEFMEKHNLTPNFDNPTAKEFSNFKKDYLRLYETLFPRTYDILHSFYSKNKGRFTNMSIFRIDSDVLIPLHTNFDPHIYRCHMGLIVPDGDIGIKVEGEVRNWTVGKFFAFDSTRPHTVWNYTGKPRYVLSIDCYRSGIKIQDAKAVHDALFKLRMNESKLSLGLSGGRSEVSEEIRRKYACEHELRSL